jgi:hypothetical protein
MASDTGTSSGKWHCIIKFLEKRVKPEEIIRWLNA